MIKEGKIISFRDNMNETMDLIVRLPRDKVVLKELKRFVNCEVVLKDKDSITALQRKKAYAIIRDIAKYTGDTPANIKNFMKGQYLSVGGADISLADCSKTEAKEFINVLLDYVIEMDIPINKEHPITLTEDIKHFLWKCIEQEKCCICGKEHSGVYSLEQIATNSKDIDIKNVNTKKICLCETHLEEFGKLGKKEFMKKYNVVGIEYKPKQIYEDLSKAFA